MTFYMIQVRKKPHGHSVMDAASFPSDGDAVKAAIEFLSSVEPGGMVRVFRFNDEGEANDVARMFR